jgi:hypothetical protein
MICHECGTLHAVRQAPSGITESCRTCGAPLYRQRRDSARRTLSVRSRNSTLPQTLQFAVTPAGTRRTVVSVSHSSQINAGRS